jgi:hypothetical protein
LEKSPPYISSVGTPAEKPVAPALLRKASTAAKDEGLILTFVEFRNRHPVRPKLPPRIVLLVESGRADAGAVVEPVIGGPSRLLRRNSYAEP